MRAALCAALRRCTSCTLQPQLELRARVSPLCPERLRSALLSSSEPQVDVDRLRLHVGDDHGEGEGVHRVEDV